MNDLRVFEKSLTLFGQGWLSFDDFMKTVRRAGIRPSVLSDDELQRIVEIVDSDGRFDRCLISDRRKIRVAGFLGPHKIG